MTSLRVCAYNVLAQALAKSDYFPWAGAALKWRVRWPALQALLLGLRADVLCLSEVDRADEYVAWLDAHGYGCAYKRRGAKQYGQLIAWRRDVLEALETAACDLNDVGDAVACGALRREDVEALAGVSLPAPRPPRNGDATSDVAAVAANGDSPPGGDVACADAAAAACRTDSVVAFAMLRVRAQPSVGVVVSCTHSFWAPDAGAVRAVQAAALQLCVADALAAARSAGGAGTAWTAIVGGDFNSRPAVDAYAVLAGQPLPPPVLGAASAAGWDVGCDVLGGGGGGGAGGRGDGPPAISTSRATPPVASPLAAAVPPPPPRPGRDAWLARIGGHVAALVAAAAARPASADASGAAVASTEEILRSAYAMHARAAGPPLPRGGGGLADADAEPAFTTHTGAFVDALDYVFVGPGCRVLSVRPMPDAADVTGGGAFPGAPNARHPSDHFPLVAEVELPGAR